MPSHFTDADVEVQRGWATWLSSRRGRMWDEGPSAPSLGPPVSQQAGSLMAVSLYPQVLPRSPRGRWV